jgi:hypothetical protein
MCANDSLHIGCHALESCRTRRRSFTVLSIVEIGMDVCPACACLLKQTYTLTALFVPNVVPSAHAALTVQYHSFETTLVLVPNCHPSGWVSPPLVFPQRICQFIIATATQSHHSATKLHFNCHLLPEIDTHIPTLSSREDWCYSGLAHRTTFL